MKHRVCLQVKIQQQPKSSACQCPIIETLEQIAKLSSNINANNEELKNKQEQLLAMLSPLQKEVASTSTNNNTKIILPLSAISNAKEILKQYIKSRNESSNDSDKVLIEYKRLKQQLEQNLKQSTKLSFINSSQNNSNTNAASTTTSTSNMTEEEKIKYKKRIERLKLINEERNYMKLTKNLDVTPEDDATISSMLYASSVGMNMIVAPISIGVLMYFFAGKLMFWVFGPTYTDSQKEGQLNIHGVIVGVISGVIMLFIEMILFVIRNHEMDAHLINKKKKRKKNAFGYEKIAAERTFHG